MKTEKLSFQSIKNVLSRDEMKKIMAGSGSSSCNPDGTCGAHQICQNGTCVGCVYC